ncbi:helix-turn-helix domain-containing protein [Kitasatospora acidiphila]|uniref:Helix-turn-helix domain-containing protein n=1 Tax=Kitasatospora acidiphila TaxID=2567942 RepID=A0A540VY04_9ACTN|nr:helix-turn-helix domain-containing protein [Kitasatospora acidiphila]TQF01641.1 helix-turn-helix domain-containing protein [Kitasatospora acidiphila]
MSVVLDTTAIPTADRAEYWHEAVSRTFIPLDVSLLEGSPAPARISSHRLGDLQISRVRSGPQRVVRSAGLIARGGEDHLTLALQHRGTARLVQDDCQVLLRPGAFAISDAGRPFAKELEEPFDFTAFHWPRSAVGVSEEDLRMLTATSFDAGEGTARLVAAYLERLARAADSLEPDVAGRLATTALDLLAVLAGELRGRSVSEPPEPARATLARVKDHILRNLGDPDLSPERIAAAHHVSVRYLHKLFRHEDATVARWIQRRRLEMCRRELARSAGRVTVAAVAGRWGFVSASHFSRAFRAAYGVSPSEWQAGPGSGFATSRAVRPAAAGSAAGQGPRRPAALAATG